MNTSIALNEPTAHQAIAVDTDQLAREVLSGLRQNPKTLPCKLFYDERGSQLFDAICELPEYYPTRTETSILKQHADSIARTVGPDACIIEPGAGSTVKIRHLLGALERPRVYVPMDISGAHLSASVRAVRDAYPDLRVVTVEADYTRDFALDEPALRPPGRSTPGRRVVFYPGSTIGNFLPSEAIAFLRRLRGLIGTDGGILIGVDLRKDRAILEAAYNDARGVTAEFNLNILNVVNEMLGADFDPALFHHEAVFDNRAGRIEMRLVSAVDHTVQLLGTALRFVPGEWIVTEYSHKYTLADFARLADRAGFAVEQVWRDERHWFSLQYLTPGPTWNRPD